MSTIAPRVNLTQLLAGADDGQWIEIEGVVQSAKESGKNIILELALSDGPITATTIKEPAPIMQAWLMPKYGFAATRPRCSIIAA